MKFYSAVALTAITRAALPTEIPSVDDFT